MSLTPNRIYAQYRNKPKAVAWYNIARTLSDTIFEASQAVRYSYRISSAEGEQLDVIGRIVVIPREYIQTISIPVIQFNGEGVYQFGQGDAQFSDTKPRNNGTALADGLYRLVILAKIMRNVGSATIEDIVAGLNIMIGETDSVQLTDNENMTFDLHFRRRLTDVERSVIMQLAIIQKPAGVKIRKITEA